MSKPAKRLAKCCLLVLVLAISTVTMARADGLAEFNEAVARLSLAEPTEEQPVSSDVLMLPTSAAPGEKVRLAIKAEVLPTWHIYAHDPSEMFIVTTHTFELSDGLTADGDWFLPMSELYDAAPTMLIYHGELLFMQDLRVAKDAKPGTETVELKFRYQACDPYICLPPEEIQRTLTLTVQ